MHYLGCEGQAEYSKDLCPENPAQPLKSYFLNARGVPSSMLGADGEMSANSLMGSHSLLSQCQCLQPSLKTQLAAPLTLSSL